MRLPFGAFPTVLSDHADCGAEESMHSNGSMVDHFIFGMVMLGIETLQALRLAAIC